MDAPWQRWGVLLALAAVATLAAPHMDPADIIGESNYEGRMGPLGSEALWQEGGDAVPSVEAMARMLAHSEGQSLITKAMQRPLREEPAPELSLFQVPEAEEQMPPITELLGIASRSGLENQEALASAKVAEDKAALQLSNDAQELEHLKGKMSLEVVKAKAQLAHPESGEGGTSAKQAASLAQAVVAKTQLVSQDRAKEKSAKSTVRKVQSMLETISDSEADEADEGDEMGASDDDDDDAVEVAEEHSDYDADEDPISQHMVNQRDRFKHEEKEEGQAVEDSKEQVAELETTVQTLTDKLKSTQENLATANSMLQKHIEAHTAAHQMFSGLEHKESHYKKAEAIKHKIAKQQALLKLQSMKISDSKEQLEKYLTKQQKLGADPTADPTAGPTVPTVPTVPTAGGASPAVAAAVQAVQHSLHSENIQSQLAPQVAQLRASMGDGPELQAAIDALVSKTVAAKVDASFRDDPAVQTALKGAVAQMRAKLKPAAGGTTAANTAQHATAEVDKVDAAASALDAAGAKLDAASGGSQGQALMAELKGMLGSR